MILSRSQLHDLSKKATIAAIEAGQYIQSQFQHVHKERYKVDSGDSKASQVVTDVDLKAQEIILGHLSDSIEAYDLGLLTEEADDDQSRLKKSYFWSVDPMDATLAFVEGRTGYAVSISLVSALGDPVIGVVYVPDLYRCYSAIMGDGVKLNGQPFMPVEKELSFHWYMDKSLQRLSNYEQIADTVEAFVSEQGFNKMIIHDTFGSVRNALGVLESFSAMYFKFPKSTIGGGCIWDYAATRLFFEELKLWVTDADGYKLDLNNPNTVYMNKVGIIYANNAFVMQFLERIKP